MNLSILSLPSDLLRSYFIPQFFLNGILSERDIDHSFPPVSIFALLFVCKRFNQLVRENPLASKTIENFHNMVSLEKARNMMKQATQVRYLSGEQKLAVNNFSYDVLYCSFTPYRF
jgi:hypothetical protein